MQSAIASSICPHCGQRAPIVLRGVEARCTACGARRPPFAAPSLTLAGQPSRVGGKLAFFSGWAVMVMGLSLALFLGLLLHSIWPASFVGLAFAVPIAILSLFFGGFLVFGGKRLHSSGEKAQRTARLEAVRAMAAHRGGSITARDVARSLELDESETDTLLTELAKDPDANVSLDIDDEGRIHYLFGTTAEARFRVLDQFEDPPTQAPETEPMHKQNRS